LVEVERPRGNDVTSAKDQDRLVAGRTADPCDLAMAGSDAALVAPLQNGMGGDQGAGFKYPDLIGQRVHFNDPLSGRVGHAVKIAADAHHAFMRDAPFQLQERAEGRQRQQFEVRLLFGEGLVDHTLGGGVHSRIGNRIEPMPQLGVQVVEVAERAGEEEVLADVPIRPLDLAFGFGPVRSASLWLEAIVPGEVNERAVVDDAAAGFADDRGLHAVVEDLAGDAADRREGRHVTTKNRLHVLVQDKARPNQPAEAEHEREQPDDARDRWLIFELQLELGKVDLRLIARWRLEADLKGRQWGRTNLAQHVSDGGIAAFVSALTKLPQKPAAGQAGIGHHTLAQIGDKRINPSLARLAWTIDGRFQATCDAFANGLAIETELTGDRRDRQSPCR